ncbi:MAG: hypothetical protein QN173_11000 [Armatimonadota bacterium]|nr:hypothetical protein [Armatimonadota bacterium]MDR7401561.1 hypothetical protein [Armatimonadota bacterium]MDR7403302.1 hypothetical protein [Armatimonadota bacterium]MDR7438202.1 hypothetical protein [Armatimonadota bacterium]MDR7471631.1 hypothetical protein [Armatimonadota bacterium]
MPAQPFLPDHHGLPLAPGLRVQVLVEPGRPEASVVRVVEPYGVVTVALADGAGRVERMYRADQVAVVVPAVASPSSLRRTA